jgi:hypothetical protein
VGCEIPISLTTHASCSIPRAITEGERGKRLGYSISAANEEDHRGVGLNDKARISKVKWPVGDWCRRACSAKCVNCCPKAAEEGDSCTAKFEKAFFC